VLGLTPDAAAQGYPVIDEASVAKAIDNLNAATEQVKQLNAMLGQVQSMVQTLGKQGLPTLLFQEALSQSGISQFAPPVKDLLDSTSQSVGSIKSVLADIDKLKGQVGALGTKPDFSNFSTASNWVRSELTTARDANLTTVNLTRKARGMLAGEAAANAYAMALNARSQLPAAADRAQQLAQRAGSANDLRGDMAANTAVLLAMHDEIAQLQALMAAVLEVQSALRLAEMDPTQSAASATGDRQ
jgi:hypothetical protein